MSGRIRTVRGTDGHTYHTLGEGFSEKSKVITERVREREKESEKERERASVCVRVSSLVKRRGFRGGRRRRSIALGKR